MLGFAFDGTGYGPDGAIWGGEVLLADYKGFRRLAHLKYVPLPGGDVSVLRPVPDGDVASVGGGGSVGRRPPPVRACPPDERGVLLHQLETGLGCVPTSSMGRLFDAVSALAGVRQVVDYEAQAAIEFEGLSRGVHPGAVHYRFDVDFAGDAPAQIDPAPLVCAVVDDVRNRVPAGVIGARFHAALTGLIVGLAAEFAPDTATVALSGGVFQNALLLLSSSAALRERGFRGDHPPAGAAQRRRYRAGPAHGRQRGVTGREDCSCVLRYRGRSCRWRTATAR